MHADGAVWLPPGCRLETVFALRDQAIAELSGFVCDVAGELERGTALSSAVRGASLRHPAAFDAFELAERTDAQIETEFALGEALTFPCEPLPAAMNFERAGVSVSFALDGFSALDLQTLLSMCGSGASSPTEVYDALDEPVAVLFDELIARGVLATGKPPATASAVGRDPGVTRLQHAGLLYRGRSAGVLVDPHLHSSYEPREVRQNFVRSQLDGLVDAILISHGHLDHFHLPTLMSFPRETPIIVPRAPRATMLCPDFAETLRALGFTRVTTLDWYGPPVSIGDLEVHAFPFYGEQPLLHEAPRSPELRNHGNTYVVRHDSYTSWLLIDSGNDRLGRMSEVACEVAARFGGVDLLISNLREFTPYTPLYITGAGHYWLSLTPDQMKRFTQMRNDLITLGPEGVAEVCKNARARTFLPYAHWWGEPGAPSGSDEQALLARLERSLARYGAETSIAPWRIGDSYVTERRGSHRGTSEGSSASVALYQGRLLRQIRCASGEPAIGEAVATAFLQLPRHRFVQRYRRFGSSDWHVLDERNLARHLPALYADRPLCLSGDDDANPLSTISQPSVVLRMLEMLRLEPGHVVFELGAGSGWNAALMAHLVGARGHVYSAEIMPELTETAAANLRALGVANVSVVSGEGGDGYPHGAPFDRVVFTAGSYDLPRCFYSQVREGGLLLMVLKLEGGGDSLRLLRKHADHFESIESATCDFVALQGKYHLGRVDAAIVEDLQQWEALEQRELERTAAPWKAVGGEASSRRTEGIRAYLSIVEPSFRAFRRRSKGLAGFDRCFGLWAPETQSLVLADDEWLISYGTRDAGERLRRRIDEWIALGMPMATSYGLAVYPIECSLTPLPNQRIVRRAESQFVWSLPERDRCDS